MAPGYSVRILRGMPATSRANNERNQPPVDPFRLSRSAGPGAGRGKLRAARSSSRHASGVLTSHWLPSAAGVNKPAENMTISRTDPFMALWPAEAVEPSGIIRPLRVAEIGREAGERVGLDWSPVSMGQLTHVCASLHDDDQIAFPSVVESKGFQCRSEERRVGKE